MDVGREIGRLSLRIVGDATGLRRQIERDIKKSGAEDIDIDVGVEADTTEAAAKVKTFTARQDGREINLDVDVDTTGLSEKVRALVQRIQAAHKIDLEAGIRQSSLGRLRTTTRVIADSVRSQLAEALGRIRSRLTINVDIDKAQLRAVEMRLERIGIISELVGRKFKLAFGFAAVGGAIGGLAMLSSYVSALSVQAVALAGGMSQAVGVIGMAPALFTGAAAAIGVLTVGFQGMGAALKQALDPKVDPAQFAESLKDLSPAARDVAMAFKEIAPALSDIRKSVQENMFYGLSNSVKELGGALKGIMPGLDAVAVGFNSTFRQLFSAFNDEANKSNMNTTLANFGQMMTKLSTGIPALVGGFSALSAAGSTFFDRIGNYGVRQMTEFYGWSKRISEDGTLQRWIDSGTRSMSLMWTSLKNVTAALGDIFNVAGMGSLAGFASLTAQMREFTESAKGSRIITEVFVNAKEAIGGFHDAVKPLGGVFLELLAGARNFTNRFAEGFTESMKGSRDAARDFASAIAGIAGPLGTGVGNALQGIAKVVAGLAPELKGAAEAIGPFISELASFAGGAGKVFLDVLTSILRVVNTLMGALPFLAPMMGALFAGGMIVTQAEKLALGLAQTAGAFTSFGKNAKDAKGAADEFGGGIVAAGDGAEKTKGKLGGVKSVLAGAARWFLPAMAGVLVFEALDAAIETNGEKLDKLAAKSKDFGQAYVQATKVSTQASKDAMNEYKKNLEERNKLLEEQYQKELERYNQANARGENSEANRQKPTQQGYLDIMPIYEAAAKAQYDALSKVQQKQQDVTVAQNDLNDAVKAYGPNSSAAESAALALATAQENLKKSIDEANESQKTAAQKAIEMANAQATLVGADAAAAQARLALADATANYNSVVAQFGEGSDQAKVALGNLQAQMTTAAETAGTFAQQTAVASGKSDGLAESFDAQRAVLQDLVNTTTGPAQAAAQALLSSLETNRAATMLGSEAFGKLKDKIVAVPNSKSVEISDNSPSTIRRLEALNFTVTHLDNGNILVTANTNPALAGAQNAVNRINTMSGTITIYTTQAGVSTNATAGGKKYFSSGGYIEGPGGPQDDLIPAMVSNGEYVIRASVVSALGVSFFDKLNKTAQVSNDGKFASGGPTSGWFDRATTLIGRNVVGQMRSTADYARSGGDTITVSAPHINPYDLAREISRQQGRSSKIIRR